MATYALHVINGTKSVLLCRTWVVSRNGEPVMAYPVPFEVGPLSTSETVSYTHLSWALPTINLL